jgi:hypothetical protein
MAFEHPILNLPDQTADADFSAKQYFCAKLSTTGNQVSVCSAAGEFVDGIIQNDPAASGDPVTIMAVGVSRVEAGGTLTRGDFWGTDATGKAVKVESTNTGADIGEWAMGRVLEGAGSGEIATVTIGLGSHLVEAA